MVNLTGGMGRGLDETIQRFQVPYPGRFVVFTEPSWERSNGADYPQFQADEIARARKAGAYGLKILKTLGLYLREGLPPDRWSRSTIRVLTRCGKPAVR